MAAENRRGFFTALSALFAGMFASANSNAATRIRVEQLRGTVTNGLVGLDGSAQGMSVTLGAGLSLTGGTLSATGSAVPVRQYNVVLTRDASGVYVLPAGVQTRTVLHRNGVRQTPVQDYNINTGVAVPVGGWAVDDLVTADGE